MERPTKRPRWEPPTTNDQAGPTTQASLSRQEHPHEFTHFGGTGLQNHSGSINVRGNLNIGSPAVLGGSSSHQQSILESLRFDQMDSRHASIKKAFRDTCKWFLQTPVYKEWENKDPSQDGNHFLWIKGKPGAGKSTLMKFLYQQMQSRSKKSNDILISFFFNARGHALEKSTVGLYRSLLVQLLEKHPSLLDKLDTPHRYDNWNIHSLKALFEQAIQGLDHAPVICLVDALDECEEEEIREMVDFFTDLVCTENRLSICFASRHYPYITIETGLSIILEKQNEHQDDITAYLGTALRIGHDQLAEKIRLDLQEKASGVFMWVVLVVDILNKEFDAGRKHTVREKVKQLPADLHELFRDILTRDSNHQDALLLCIQWVLFAKRPLTPKELYFAILSGYEPQYLVDCHSDSTSDEDIYKYILNNSKGVVENTKAKIPTVQFIHESVRDFLLKEGGLGQIFPALKVNTHGQSHEALKHCCLTYMNVGTTIEKKVEDPTSQTTKQALPFLEYAIAGILHHSEQAENSGVSQSEFLAEFPRQEWIVQHNLLQMHKTRRHTPQASLLYILAESDASGLIRAHGSWQSFFKVEDERYGLPVLAAMATKSTAAVQTMLEIHGNQSSKFSWAYFQSITPSPLGDFFCSSSRNFNFNRRQEITAELLKHGCEGLLLFLLLTDQCDIESKSSTGRTLLELAIDKGYNIVLQELHRRNDTISTVNEVREAWLEAKDVATVKSLLILGADTSVQNELGETLLFRSIQTRSKKGYEVAKLLIESGADCSIATDKGETPLHFISKNFCSLDMDNMPSIVDLLAESGGTNGANLSITDKEGRTPLHDACRNTDFSGPAISLIEYGANVSATDNKGRTPLHDACESTPSTEVAILLMEHGADVSATDNKGRTPLHDACRNTYFSGPATSLRKHGADLSATDKEGRTPLYNAYKSTASPNIAILLIERGADLSITDKEGRTPLHDACRNTDFSGPAISLIEQGANVSATDNEGRTPLHDACVWGDCKVAISLMERGADVSATDNEGRTPLHDAYRRINSKVAILLIEHGVDISVTDNKGRTPLHHIAINSLFDSPWSEHVGLLIKHGADVSTTDIEGKTPLHYACSNKGYDGNGLLELVTSLVQHGADALITDQKGRTPLDYANEINNIEIVELLNERGGNIANVPVHC